MVRWWGDKTHPGRRGTGASNITLGNTEGKGLLMDVLDVVHLVCAAPQSRNDKCAPGDWEANLDFLAR